MKKILAILCLLFFNISVYAQYTIPYRTGAVVGGASVSWSFVRAACSGLTSTGTNCPAGAMANTATTQTGTFSAALSSGDTLAIGVLAAGAVAPSSITCVSVACTVVGPDANCSINDTVNNGVSLFCYYVVSLTGGQTGVTVNFLASTLFYFVAAAAHKTGGAPAFDASNSILMTPACTLCTGAAITLTGSKDAIFRWVFQGSGAPSAITGGFTFDTSSITDFTNASSYLMNATTGTAPTYTFGVSDTGNEGGLAFK